MSCISLPTIIFNPEAYSPDESTADTTDMMEKMAENILTFTNAEFGSIRVMEIDGQSWFVGKDVAVSLGYSNASKAVMSHVDEDDKRFEMCSVSDSQNGNLVKTALINESGLYSLIMSSKLPTAKQFKRWVTSEVLYAY